MALGSTEDDNTATDEQNRHRNQAPFGDGGDSLTRTEELGWIEDNIAEANSIQATNKMTRMVDIAPDFSDSGALVEKREIAVGFARQKLAVEISTGIRAIPRVRNVVPGRDTNTGHVNTCIQSAVHVDHEIEHLPL